MKEKCCAGCCHSARVPDAVVMKGGAETKTAEDPGDLEIKVMHVSEKS